MLCYSLNNTIIPSLILMKTRIISFPSSRNKKKGFFARASSTILTSHAQWTTPDHSIRAIYSTELNQLIYQFHDGVIEIFDWSKGTKTRICDKAYSASMMPDGNLIYTESVAINEKILVIYDIEKNSYHQVAVPYDRTKNISEGTLQNNQFFLIDFYSELEKNKLRLQLSIWDVSQEQAVEKISLNIEAPGIKEDTPRSYPSYLLSENKILLLSFRDSITKETNYCMF